MVLRVRARDAKRGELMAATKAEMTDVPEVNEVVLVDGDAWASSGPT